MEQTAETENTDQLDELTEGDHGDYYVTITRLSSGKRCINLHKKLAD